MEKLLKKLKELEQFIEKQSRFYAFRKYSYPFLSKWIEEVRRMLNNEVDIDERSKR